MIASDEKFLLQLAKVSIIHGLRHDAPAFCDPRSIPENLSYDSETFVSVYRDNQIVGCIGNPHQHKPLYYSILQNAFKAAFRDDRFSGVKSALLDEYSVSYSILASTKNSWLVNSVETFVQLIKPDHSLILTYEGCSALMLPSMQCEFENLAEFVNATRTKAKIDSSIAWSQITGTLVKTYTSPIVALKDIEDVEI